MTLRTRIAGLFLFCLLGWWLPPLRSQDLTFFVGATAPGDLKRGDVRIRLDNGPLLGVRFCMSFAEILGLEHSVAYSPDYLFPTDQHGINEAKGFIYHTNFIVQLPAGRLRPYGTFGVGLIWQYGSENLPVGLEFAVNYGGGVKMPRLWGPVGLRFDARGYTVPKVFSTKLNIFEISGGLLVSF